MGYLAAALVFNVIVSAVLKLFPRYEVRPLQAISVNYATCVVTGFFATGAVPFVSPSGNSTWIPWALLMGVVFIGIFRLMAHCTKVDGMATTVMANKLSLVIPVIFALVVYEERLTALKTAGILLAFPAVYLSTRSGDDRGEKKTIGWAALLFVLSGGLDALINYVQTTYLHHPSDRAGCTVTTFATAAAIGLLMTGWQAVKSDTPIHGRSLVAGVMLGIPNFFSIYFLVLGLHGSVLQSSATIPVFNISILVATTMVAIVAFREKASKWQAAGLALAITAIAMIAAGDAIK